MLSLLSKKVPGSLTTTSLMLTTRKHSRDRTLLKPLPECIYDNLALHGLYGIYHYSYCSLIQGFKALHRADDPQTRLGMQKVVLYLVIMVRMRSRCAPCQHRCSLSSCQDTHAPLAV